MIQLDPSSFPDIQVCLATRDLAETASEPFLYSRASLGYRQGTTLGSEFCVVHISPDLSSPQCPGRTASISLIYTACTAKP